MRHKARFFIQPRYLCASIVHMARNAKLCTIITQSAGELGERPTRAG